MKEKVFCINCKRFRDSAGPSCVVRTDVVMSYVRGREYTTENLACCEDRNPKGECEFYIQRERPKKSWLSKLFTRRK